MKCSKCNKEACSSKQVKNNGDIDGEIYETTVTYYYCKFHSKEI